MCQSLPKFFTCRTQLDLPAGCVLVLSPFYDSEAEAHSHQMVEPRFKLGHLRHHCSSFPTNFPPFVARWCFYLNTLLHLFFTPNPSYGSARVAPRTRKGTRKSCFFMPIARKHGCVCRIVQERDYIGQPACGYVECLWNELIGMGNPPLSLSE